MDNNELMKIRTTIYLRNLLPLDDKIVKSLPFDKINLNRNQVFICKKDVHRELFCKILLDTAKIIDRRPSYEMVTLVDLIDKHFDNEHSSMSLIVQPDILFIYHSLVTLENKIYGPVLDKIVEERKLYGKRTYVFYKGVLGNFNSLGVNSMDEIVDLNGISRTTHKKNEVI